MCHCALLPLLSDGFLDDTDHVNFLVLQGLHNADEKMQSLYWNGWRELNHFFSFLGGNLNVRMTLHLDLNVGKLKQQGAGLVEPFDNAGLLVQFVGVE